MFEKYLIEHCSPTLGGLKTANLFNYPYDDETALKADVKKWNRELNKKGIILEIIKQNTDTALIYVYRVKKLREDINNENAKKFLYKYGYEDFNTYYMIKRLKTRLRESEEFPHEIGMFLGYPLEDVKGFIENAGQNSKCSGCWKVYCNECEAVKIFNKFNKCKKIYSKLFLSGSTISKLTVSIQNKK
ncbi:DUF3793 family protein [Anaerofustis stercorihominis]|nr:DUF3793 family protein [Anaerofustis stercorihominis]MCQ4794289.1 DUF3793 family protein [Anaerofustis stercorihominis]